MKKILFILLVAIYIIPLFIIGILAVFIKLFCNYDLTDSKVVGWIINPVNQLEDSIHWDKRRKNKK